MNSEKETLKPFAAHGFVYERMAGNQAVGSCPFCDKDGHFFINAELQLWDCKRCGEKGNLFSFLEKISKKNVEALLKNEGKLRELVISRKLPKSAFAKWEVGWNGTEYTLPVRSWKGSVEDLRRYTLGGKTLSTPGMRVGLLGAHKLEKMPQADAYICEGEWDTIALAWLFKKLDTNSVAVGVPGANVFKLDWVEYFRGRKVFLLHDHDSAGDTGRKLCLDRLKGVTGEIKVVDWPGFLPQGYDVRDFITSEAIAKQKPRHAWNELKKLLKIPEQTKLAPTAVATPSVPIEEKRFTGKRILPEEVAEAYRKWLHLPSDEVLQIIFGAIFANKIQGDPIWLFLVAPPGGSKSELLMSLSKNPMIETTTSLTPHTLISGMRTGSGNDPSLIPKLNNRILVIKDFTTILSMHYSGRDEIFGALRDSYDGKTEKIFGGGFKRAYVSKFGILAGVTPKIEEFGAMHQSLGERFLKYRIDTGVKTTSEADRIRKALKNINQEVQMREELCVIASQVVSTPLPDTLPTIPEGIFEKIVNLAQTCAMMRGVVERDRYTQQVLYKPAIEVGTRLSKQLAKLAIGIAVYLQKPEIDQETYGIVCRVALNTAPDRVEDIIRRLWEGCKAPEDVMKTGEVSLKTHLPVGTCFKVLQDLELLEIVNRVGSGSKYEWRLGEKLLKLIEESGVYKN